MKKTKFPLGLLVGVIGGGICLGSGPALPLSWDGGTPLQLSQLEKKVDPSLVDILGFLGSPAGRAADGNRDNPFFCGRDSYLLSRN